MKKNIYNIVCLIIVFMLGILLGILVSYNKKEIIVKEEKEEEKIDNVDIKYHNGEIYYAYFYGNNDGDKHYYLYEIDNTEIIEFDGVDYDTNDKVLKLTKKRTK